MVSRPAVQPQIVTPPFVIGNIFVPSFEHRTEAVFYCVQVCTNDGSRGWQVVRRYTNFETLSGTVSRLQINRLNHELPGKIMFAKTADLERRRERLEEWIQQLVPRAATNTTLQQILSNFCEVSSHHSQVPLSVSVATSIPVTQPVMSSSPPVAMATPPSLDARMTEIRRLRDEGFISNLEFDAKRSEVLGFRNTQSYDANTASRMQEIDSMVSYTLGRPTQQQEQEQHQQQHTTTKQPPVRSISVFEI